MSIPVNDHIRAGSTGPCRYRTSLQEDDGGALIEAALVLPVFLMMVFGIVQFGILFFGYGSASYAARVAARYASLHSSTSISPATTASVQAVVAPYMWMGNKSSSSVTPTWLSNSKAVGSTVTVAVAITYNVALPFSRTRQIIVGSTAQRQITR